MTNFSRDFDPARLIDALYEARRNNRRDLASEIVPLLRHVEPIVREEAISLLLTKWGLSHLHETVRDLLLKDEDEGVRSRAAFGLAAISTPATNIEDALALSAVFEAAEYASPLRGACVEALHLMLGRVVIVDAHDVDQRAVQALLSELVARTPS